MPKSQECYTLQLQIKNITYTGCLYTVIFPQNFVIFLNSASSAALLVSYLPGGCTVYSDTDGKQRKAGVRNILKSSEKHNI